MVSEIDVPHIYRDKRLGKTFTICEITHIPFSGLKVGIIKTVIGKGVNKDSQPGPQYSQEFFKELQRRKEIVKAK